MKMLALLVRWGDRIFSGKKKKTLFSDTLSIRAISGSSILSEQSFFLLFYVKKKLGIHMAPNQTEEFLKVRKYLKEIIHHTLERK